MFICLLFICFYWILKTSKLLGSTRSESSGLTNPRPSCLYRKGEKPRTLPLFSFIRTFSLSIEPSILWQAHAPVVIKSGPRLTTALSLLIHYAGSVLGTVYMSRRRDIVLVSGRPRSRPHAGNSTLLLLLPLLLLQLLSFQTP